MCIDELSCPSTLRPTPLSIVHAQRLNGPTEKVLRQDLTPHTPRTQMTYDS
jgi:hypothetical protein